MAPWTTFSRRLSANITSIRWAGARAMLNNESKQVSLLDASSIPRDENL